MRFNTIFIVLFFVLISLLSTAQEDTILVKNEVYKPPVPVEIMLGNEALLFKMVVTKPIYNSKFKFYNLMTFESNFINSSATNIFNQTVVFYDVFSKFSVGIGSNYSSYSNLKPVASVLYSNFTSNRGFILQPSMVLEKNGAKELFSMFEYTYVFHPKFKGYFRLDAFTSWQKRHEFSYLNWRVGINSRVGRFGPAITIQFVGDKAYQFYNFGAFYNISI